MKECIIRCLIYINERFEYCRLIKVCLRNIEEPKDFFEEFMCNGLYSIHVHGQTLGVNELRGERESVFFWGRREGVFAKKA